MRDAGKSLRGQIVQRQKETARGGRESDPRRRGGAQQHSRRWLVGQRRAQEKPPCYLYYCTISSSSFTTPRFDGWLDVLDRASSAAALQRLTLLDTRGATSPYCLRSTEWKSWPETLYFLSCSRCLDRCSGLHRQRFDFHTPLSVCLHHRNRNEQLARVQPGAARSKYLDLP